MTVVTDHALIRWLDRVHGIDMEDIRAVLAAIAQPYADAGVKHAFVGGVWFVFEDRRLITVTPDKPHAHSVRRHDRKSVNGTDMGLSRNDLAADKRRKMQGKQRR